MPTVAAGASFFTSTEQPLAELLGRLSRSGYLPRRAVDLFHYLRKAGNVAAHTNVDDHAAALSALKVARELAIWFVRGYGRKPTLKVGPFLPPSLIRRSTMRRSRSISSSSARRSRKRI
jgi:type I restriction enzyme, R subunit